MKFGFDWPSDFRGEDVWALFTQRQRRLKTTDDGALVYLVSLTAQDGALVNDGALVYLVSLTAHLVSLTAQVSLKGNRRVMQPNH